MDESCRRYGCVTSCAGMSAAAAAGTVDAFMQLWVCRYIHQTCHRHEWVMSQIWMRHVTHMNDCRFCCCPCGTSVREASTHEYIKTFIRIMHESFESLTHICNPLMPPLLTPLLHIRKIANVHENMKTMIICIFRLYLSSMRGLHTLTHIYYKRVAYVCKSVRNDTMCVKVCEMTHPYLYMYMYLPWDVCTLFTHICNPLIEHI